MPPKTVKARLSFNQGSQPSRTWTDEEILTLMDCYLAAKEQLELWVKKRRNMNGLKVAEKRREFVADIMKKAELLSNVTIDQAEAKFELLATKYEECMDTMVVTRNRDSNTHVWFDKMEQYQIGNAAMIPPFIIDSDGFHVIESSADLLSIPNDADSSTDTNSPPSGSRNCITNPLPIQSTGTDPRNSQQVRKRKREAETESDEPTDTEHSWMQMELEQLKWEVRREELEIERERRREENIEAERKAREAEHDAWMEKHDAERKASRAEHDAWMEKFDAERKARRAEHDAWMKKHDAEMEKHDAEMEARREKRYAWMLEAIQNSPPLSGNQRFMMGMMILMMWNRCI